MKDKKLVKTIHKAKEDHYDERYYRKMKEPDIDYNFTEIKTHKKVNSSILIILLGGVMMIVGLTICCLFILFLVVGMKEGFHTMATVSGIAEIIGIILAIIGFKLL